MPKIMRKVAEEEVARRLLGAKRRANREVRKQGDICGVPVQPQLTLMTRSLRRRGNAVYVLREKESVSVVVCVGESDVPAGYTEMSSKEVKLTHTRASRWTWSRRPRCCLLGSKKINTRSVVWVASLKGASRVPCHPGAYRIYLGTFSCG